MARRTGNEVRVLGVAGRDQQAPMREFVARHDLGHVTHLVDADGRLWEHFGVPGQPAWVLIDERGRLVERLFGAVPVRELERKLAELAGAAGGG